MPRLYPRLALLAASLLPLAASGQHKLSSIGLLGGSGFLLPHWPQADISLPGYELSNTKAEDIIGGFAYQGGLYARFEDNEKWWFLQPEVQYTHGTASYLSVSPSRSSSGNYGEDLARAVRRADLGLLVGARYSEGRGGFMIGPVLARNFAPGPVTAQSAENQELLDALTAAQRPYQLLGRVALGSLMGSFTMRMAYEFGLTPYIGKLQYKGQSYPVSQNNHLFTLSIGLRLYEGR